MSVTLAQERKLLQEAKQEAADRFYRTLVSQNGTDALLTSTQAAGYLAVTTNTLKKLDIKSVDLTGTEQGVRYRKCDIDAFLERRKG